jgi:hypothetical protein
MSWNGIGIGWPNATSGIGNQQGWFAVPETCASGPVGGAYTQYFEYTDYKEGDYVYSPEELGYVLLGAFQKTEPTITKPQTIEGAAINSCPI